MHFHLALIFLPLCHGPPLTGERFLSYSAIPRSRDKQQRRHRLRASHRVTAIAPQQGWEKKSQGMETLETNSLGTNPALRSLLRSRCQSPAIPLPSSDANI